MLTAARWMEGHHSILLRREDPWKQSQDSPPFCDGGSTTELDERVWGDTTTVPLGTAAQKGHVEVVRHLIEQFGVDSCGGGAPALHYAAESNTWTSWLS